MGNSLQPYNISDINSEQQSNALAQIMGACIRELAYTNLNEELFQTPDGIRRIYKSIVSIVWNRRGDISDYYCDLNPKYLSSINFEDESLQEVFEKLFVRTTTPYLNPSVAIVTQQASLDDFFSFLFGVQSMKRELKEIVFMHGCPIKDDILNRMKLFWSNNPEFSEISCTTCIRTLNATPYVTVDWRKYEGPYIIKYLKLKDEEDTSFVDNIEKERFCIITPKPRLLLDMLEYRQTLFKALGKSPTLCGASSHYKKAISSKDFILRGAELMEYIS